LRSWRRAVTCRRHHHETHRRPRTDSLGKAVTRGARDNGFGAIGEAVTIEQIPSVAAVVRDIAVMHLPSFNLYRSAGILREVCAAMQYAVNGRGLCLKRLDGVHAVRRADGKEAVDGECQPTGVTWTCGRRRRERSTKGMDLSLYPLMKQPGCPRVHTASA